MPDFSLSRRDVMKAVAATLAGTALPKLTEPTVREPAASLVPFDPLANNVIEIQTADGVVLGSDSREVHDAGA